MIFYPDLQSLPFFICSLALALAAATPISDASSSELQIPSNNTLSSKPHNLQCYSTLPYSIFFLKSSTCEEAILHMKDTTEEGTFHYGDPSDDFELPWEKTVGNCKVSVEMYNLGLYDKSSWSKIGHRASQLNRICSDTWKLRYKGGLMTTGDRDNIKITLTYLSPFAGISENVTAEAVDT